MAGIISSGCTVSASFDIGFPIDMNDVDNLYVTFQQLKTVVEKSKDDVIVETTAEGSVITCDLSQEETLKFSDRYGEIRIQIRIKYNDGTVTKSNVMTASTDELLKQGVI